MKRSEIPKYIPPPLRSKNVKDCFDKIVDDDDKDINEAKYYQVYCSGKHNYSQKKSTNIIPRRVRLDSCDSFLRRNISDDDDDSSDFDDSFCDFVPTGDSKINNEINENNSNNHWKEEERSDFVPTGDSKINNETNENNSNYHWEEGERSPAGNYHSTEIENYHIRTKSPNRNLMQDEDYPDVKSHSNQGLELESNGTETDRRLFSNYGDNSISDIDDVIGNYSNMGSVLTSTPNSDIVKQKISDVAKYKHGEENEAKSTLFGQNGINETMINKNIYEHCGNFDIYRDPSSTKDEPPDHTEIFGDSYIPPPVQPPASTSRLPPMYRLNLSALSPSGILVPLHVPFQNRPQLYSQLKYPQHIVVPSLRLCPRTQPSAYSSPHMSHIPHHVLSPCLKSAYIPPPVAPRMVAPISKPLMPQERINPSHSLQDVFNPSSLNLRSISPRNLESSKQDYSFYIPPPLSNSQLEDGSQQINSPNPSENVQSCLPHSNLTINRMVFDTRIWPPSLKTKR